MAWSPVEAVQQDPWQILIWLGSAGFLACLVPQLMRTLKRRHAEDFSIPFLVTVLLASAFTLPYQVHIGQYVFASTQVANLIVWGIVLYYRLHPGGPVAAAKTP